MYAVTEIWTEVETEAEMGTTVRKGAEMQTETWTEMGMRTEIETKRKKKRCESIPLTAHYQNIIDKL